MTARTKSTRLTSVGPIVDRSVSELRPYQRNPRHHPEQQLVKLTAAIRQYGFLVPVLINSSNEIIAGEARLEAAKRAGLTHVPAIAVDHLTEGEVRAFRLADNRIAEQAEWNMQMLAVELEEILTFDDIEVETLGWETAEIDVILETAAEEGDGKPDPADAAIVPPKIAVSRPGDLWMLGEHRLLCGSSLDVTSWSQLMNGATATMAFTDAPYNVPISGHVCGLGKVQHAEFAMASGEMSEAEFTEFLKSFLTAMANHLKDGAIIAACIDWRHLFEIQTAARAAGLSLINLCVWDKSNGGMGSLYRSKHELVLILKKGKASHINNVELGKHGRYRTNVWNYAGVNSFGRTRDADLASHPTVKPVALVADAIRDVSRHGDIVLDAFMGSGTTILAAERTGRTAYGIDIEPVYIDVAIRRWEAITGRSAVLEASGQSFAEVGRERQATSTSEAEPTPLAEAA